jgi:hypothetical protein
MRCMTRAKVISEDGPVVMTITGCPVIRLEARPVGKPYPSVDQAAKTLGMSPTTLRQAIENGQFVAGGWWAYADMPIECQKVVSKPRTKIIRDLDGKVFASISEAAREYGFTRSNKGPFAKISRAIRSGKPAFGSLWAGRIVHPKHVTRKQTMPQPMKGSEG